MTTEELRAERQASLARIRSKQLHRSGRPLCGTCLLRPAGLSGRMPDGSYKFRSFRGNYECFECSADRCGHLKPYFVYRMERV